MALLSAPAVPSVSPGLPARPTAVVVDDDPDIRDLLEMRLTRAGLSVWTYGDGASGTKAVLDMRPDLAILDWMLPGRSGLEICRDIRSEPTTEHTGIIIITARTQEPYREWGYQAGCDHFLTKPFTGPDLLRVTSDLLGGGPDAA